MSSDISEYERFMRTHMKTNKTNERRRAAAHSFLSNINAIFENFDRGGTDTLKIVIDKEKEKKTQVKFDFYHGNGFWKIELPYSDLIINRAIIVREVTRYEGGEKVEYATNNVTPETIKWFFEYLESKTNIKQKIRSLLRQQPIEKTEEATTSGTQWVDEESPEMRPEEEKAEKGPAKEVEKDAKAQPKKEEEKVVALDEKGKVVEPQTQKEFNDLIKKGYPMLRYWIEDYGSHKRPFKVIADALEYEKGSMSVEDRFILTKSVAELEKKGEPSDKEIADILGKIMLARERKLAADVQKVQNVGRTMTRGEELSRFRKLDSKRKKR